MRHFLNGLLVTVICAIYFAGGISGVALSFKYGWPFGVANLLCYGYLFYGVRELVAYLLTKDDD